MVSKLGHEWVKFIPLFYADVITYPCPNPDAI